MCNGVQDVACQTAMDVCLSESELCICIYYDLTLFLTCGNDLLC